MIWLGRIAGLRVDAGIAAQDVVDGAFGRDAFNTVVLQNTAQLPGSPGRVLISELQHELFHLRRSFVWSTMRRTAAVIQVLAEASSFKPFVASLTTDAVVAAQSAEGAILCQGLGNKSQSFGQNSSLFPRH